MLFFIHVAFALGLLSLTAGAALYIWATRNRGVGSSIGKIIGLIVTILSAIAVVCTLYCSIPVYKAYFMRFSQMHEVQIQQTMMQNNNTSTVIPKSTHHKK